MVTTFRRKQNRLPLRNYADTHAYLLTLAAEKRRREFNDALVTFCLEKLSAIAIKHEVSVLAYCFMPNHLHLLAYAANPSFVPAFVRDFKQITGFTFKKRTGRTLWQKSYHDHILRSEESARRAAQCIAANPVRAVLSRARPSTCTPGRLSGSGAWWWKAKAIRYMDGPGYYPLWTALVPRPAAAWKAKAIRYILGAIPRSWVRRTACGGRS